MTSRKKVGPDQLRLGVSQLRVLVAAGFTGPLLASALPPNVTSGGLARLFMVEKESAMAKAAVLYGDGVRLAGPRVSVIQAYLEARSAPPGRHLEDRRARLRQAFGWWPERDDSPLVDPHLGYPVPNPVPEEVYESALEEVLESRGWREIVELQTAGHLQVEPFGTSLDGFHPGALLGEMIVRLGRGIADPSEVAMLDRMEGAILRAAESAGLAARTSPVDQQEAWVAASLLGQLPAFPTASVSAILEARDRVRPSLSAFRSAVLEFCQDLTSVPGSVQFEHEAARLYRRRVAPAMEDLTRLTNERAFGRIVATRAVSGYAGAMTKAAVTLFAAAGVGAPTPAQLVSGAAVAGLDIAGQAIAKRRDVERELRANRLLWLYEVESSLSRGRRHRVSSVDSDMHPR